LFSSGSSSTYHSLQASFTKRLSGGLPFEGAYTWAKNLTSVTSSSFGVITSQANAPRQVQFGLKFLW
jgi:hypothetical protein